MKKLLTEWRKFLKESTSSKARQPQLHTVHASGYFEDFLDDYVHHDGKKITLGFGTRFKNHPDRNEPENALWTSTAQNNDPSGKKQHSYTSEWDEYNKEMGQQAGGSPNSRQFPSIGSVLMQAGPDARILELSDDNYQQILSKYGVGSKSGFLNWENLAKDYDAVHFDGPSENLRTTEVESTVILDPSKYNLKSIRTWETLLAAVKKERFGSASHRPNMNNYYLPIIQDNPELKDTQPSQQELVTLFNESPEFKEYVLNLEMEQ
tara:strand:+ start:2778 stop:3569 length:792 start_codon:yes stop_codon:yes gene_type:complete